MAIFFNLAFELNTFNKKKIKFLIISMNIDLFDSNTKETVTTVTTNRRYYGD